MQNFSITRSSENIHRYAASSALLARNHRSRIETQVSNILGDEEPGIVLITTGSDGRDENKIFESDRSNIELLMVGESMDTIGHMTELLESLKQKISTRIDFCEVFSRDSRVVSYADGDPALVFPSRMWDSKLMWGNVSPYHPLRTQVSEEILKIPKMTTHFKPRLDYHRRALRHGSSRFKGVDIPLYDLQKGILSYGKNFGPDGVTEWVKVGPLRVVQYTLVYGLMRKIAEIGAHLPFIHTLPPNIYARLEYLKQSGLTALTLPEIRALQEWYVYFLKIYHDLQYTHLTSGETEFEISSNDKKDFEEMLQVVLGICSDPLRFYGKVTRPSPSVSP